MYKKKFSLSLWYMFLLIRTPTSQVHKIVCMNHKQAFQKRRKARKIMWMQSLERGLVLPRAHQRQQTLHQFLRNLNNRQWGVQFLFDLMFPEHPKVCFNWCVVSLKVQISHLMKERRCHNWRDFLSIMNKKIGREHCTVHLKPPNVKTVDMTAEC